MHVMSRSFPQGIERAQPRAVDDIWYMRTKLRCPLAMHSRGRTVLVENLDVSISLSGLVRHFEYYELQSNSATIINQARASLFCLAVALLNVSQRLLQCGRDLHGLVRMA
jgi:phage terminase large subunit-like protein